MAAVQDYEIRFLHGDGTLSLLFVTSCASCHGATGGGAIAPAIAGRNVSLDVIRTTIANGRTGTPMPPFKDAFDAKSLALLDLLFYRSDGCDGSASFRVISE